MIHSVLQKLPLGENAKVALGVLFVCGVGTLPMLSKRGKLSKQGKRGRRTGTAAEPPRTPPEAPGNPTGTLVDLLDGGLH